MPSVRRHPVSGRKSLFLSAHAGAIGWPRPHRGTTAPGSQRRSPRRQRLARVVWSISSTRSLPSRSWCVTRLSRSLVYSRFKMLLTSIRAVPSGYSRI